jgi:molybdate/tungstate transport system substrate-binding protein
LHAAGKKLFSLAVAVAVVTSLIAGTWLSVESYSQENNGKVFVMYAGSLASIFETSLGPSFQNETGYTYVGEAKGSVQIANMIIDQQRNPDVFVSAGKTPIVKLENHNLPLAYWSLSFASAEIVIAYTSKSPFFNDLEKARKGDLKWYEVLSENELKFRRSDPELDPKGYYMIMVAKLANLYYNDTSIKDNILGEDRNTKQLLPEETLKTTLESGQIDAIAAYKHEAVADGLPYITLPKEINLSDPKFTDFYKQAAYTFSSGQTINGEPIYFSLTIPETNKNTQGSIAFVKFLLSETEKQLLEKNGLNPISLILDGQTEKIPDTLKNLAGG